MLGPFLAAALALFGLPSRQPGNPHPALPENPSPRLTGQEAEATLQSVSPDAVVLARPGAPLTIQVGPGTPVLLDGRVATVAALHPGQRVHVSYDAIDGPARANWIQVLPLEKGSRS